MNLFSSKPVKVEIDMTGMQAVMDRFEKMMQDATAKKVSTAFETGLMIGLVAGTVFTIVAVAMNKKRYS